MSDEDVALKCIEERGFSSFSDLIIATPELDLYSAAEYLGVKEPRLSAKLLEDLLRKECEKRDDWKFFARVTLFTALRSGVTSGWTSQNYLMFGIWSGMLGEAKETFADECWDRLQGLSLPVGWRPLSIFDTRLENALNIGG